MGVFVAGMHRSGTSAITSLLGDLGFERPVDLLPPAPDNKEGFAESESLTAYNDMLLAELGGSWLLPPDVQDWGPILALKGPEGLRRFIRAYPQSGANGAWAWKDPRLCILLPFWRSVLESDPVRLIVPFRHPARVAASLDSENRRAERIRDRAFGAALWERYNHCLLDGLRPGDAVLLVHYERLVDDGPYRDRWAMELADYVRGDVDVTAPVAIEAVRRRIKPELAGHREIAATGLPAGQAALLRQLEVRADEFALSPFATAPETPSTAVILEAHSQCGDQCSHRSG